MSKLNNSKKKVLKRVKDAMRRSETVSRNKYAETKPEGLKGVTPGPAIVDEVMEMVDVIHLVKPPVGSEDGPTIVCTCGYFVFGPDTNLLTLGRAGKKHAEETGHQLRKH